MTILAILLFAAIVWAALSLLAIILEGRKRR